MLNIKYGDIFQKCLVTGKLPDKLKIREVITVYNIIFKQKLIYNYIISSSLLPTISGIYETVHPLYSQLYEYRLNTDAKYGFSILYDFKSYIWYFVFKTV